MKIEIPNAYSIIGPLVFEDDNGNRFECYTDRQFDEMMDREDLHLVFD